MSSGYSGKAVGNWFLAQFEERRLSCTQLQLNKLVYIAHGWHLAAATDGNGMVGEAIHAWKFGPVIPSLREEFREFGSQPITARATDWIGLGDEYIPNLEDEDAEAWEYNLLQWVMNKYSGLSGPQLIGLTHQEKTPWSIVTNCGLNVGNDKVIPSQLIREYYSELLARLQSNAR